MLPEAVPLLCGVNVTLTGALCPAASALGNETPFKLKSGLLGLADETVTFDPPEFVTLWYWLALLPTCTLPKLLLVGFALNIPALAPAPVSGMERVES